MTEGIRDRIFTVKKMFFFDTGLMPTHIHLTVQDEFDIRACCAEQPEAPIREVLPTVAGMIPIWEADTTRCECREAPPITTPIEYEQAKVRLQRAMEASDADQRADTIRLCASRIEAYEKANLHVENP